MDNKTLLIVLGVVAVLGVASAGMYILLTKEGEYDWHLGKYDVFQVSGSSGATVFDGTFKMENTAVKGSMITVTVTYDIHYRVGAGPRTPFLVMTETDTINAKEMIDTWVFQSTGTLATNWGNKAVDIYIESKDGTTVKMWVDRDNKFVCYKMEVIIDGFTLTFTLSASNYL